MNKDLLLDAIGMVDEQKLREAADIKRTKRVTGCTAVLAVLLAAITLLVAVFIARTFFYEKPVEYTLAQLEHTVSHANVVTIYEEPGPSSPQTITAPSDCTEILRIAQWIPVPQKEAQKQLGDTEAQGRLSIHGTTLVFYDGYVTAEMYDWDLFEGTFAVPEGLWQDVLQDFTS